MAKFWKFVIALLILVAVLACLYFFWWRREETPSSQPVEKEMIKVTRPRPGDLIDPALPLVIEGEARGNWYFEASFQIRVLDKAGNELYLGFAQAAGDWMTENFVPFKVEVDLKQPESFDGEVILERDNPSGLPENAAEIKIPVRFKIEATLKQFPTVKNVVISINGRTEDILQP